MLRLEQFSNVCGEIAALQVSTHVHVFWFVLKQIRRPYIISRNVHCN